MTENLPWPQRSSDGANPPTRPRRPARRRAPLPEPAARVRGPALRRGRLDVAQIPARYDHKIAKSGWSTGRPAHAESLPWAPIPAAPSHAERTLARCGRTLGQSGGSSRIAPDSRPPDRLEPGSRPDSLTLLSAIAAVNDHLRLAASAVIAPLCRPLLLAREAAPLSGALAEVTVDDGRVVVVQRSDASVPGGGLPSRDRPPMYRCLWPQLSVTSTGSFLMPFTKFERTRVAGLMAGGVQVAADAGHRAPGLLFQGAGAHECA
jgi:hypothetical protein